jgi:hypothetical protein
MAIGLIFQAQGVTRAQYEQVRDEVVSGNTPAPGMLYHAGGPSENGWCVVADSSSAGRDTPGQESLTWMSS